MYKESIISLMIGFAFSSIVFLSALDRVGQSGAIFGIVIIGFMVSGYIFFVWIGKQNLRN